MHQRLHESVEETLERIETILHRGSEAERKNLLKGLGMEIGRLPDNLHALFIDHMYGQVGREMEKEIGSLDEDYLDEVEVAVGSEFEDE